MRKKWKSKIPPLGFLFTIILFSLASISISYSIWTDDVDIQSSITIGTTENTESAWARMYDDPDNFTYEFPGYNWATYIINHPTETPTTFYLYAAQHQRVGELIVSKNTTHLLIEYRVDYSYDISESHVHVATSLYDIPQKNGNPIPGRFDYKKNHEPPVTEYTYKIPWMESWDNQVLTIAAHACCIGPFL